MGSPPPPDAPSPDVQSAILADASFEKGPPVASLCGYNIPSFKFSFGLKIPGGLPPFPPTLFFALGINCDANNPLDITGGVQNGGGRKPQFDPDPDNQ